MGLDNFELFYEETKKRLEEHGLPFDEKRLRNHLTIIDMEIPEKVDESRARNYMESFLLGCFYMNSLHKYR